MAKRDTGVGSKNKNKKSPHKTKKRLTIKYARLSALAEKRGK
ncbi:MAG: hypothetical protein ACREHC_05200 [Candidatus Levyibacteriota bacterium]